MNMEVTVEKLAGSRISLGIEIPPEVSKGAYEKTVREASKTVNIPGFRRGKVPRQLLIQRLGERRLKEFALQELLQENIQAAIEREKVEPLGNNYDLDPQFEDLVERYQPGKELNFAVLVDVSPEVPLDASAYQDLTVKAEKVEATQEQVDDYLEQLRVRRATLVPVEDRPAQLGDVTVIDYEGFFTDGEERQPIEGAVGQDFDLELLEDKFLPEIVAGLVGMEPGAEKEVSLTFPVDYPREELAGRAATFAVALKELKEKELPELDDDFVSEIGEHETLADFRAYLEKQFREQAEEQTKNNVRAALTEALVATVEFDLPASMVDREAQALVSQTVMQMSQYGVDVRKMLTEEVVANMREEAKPEATARLRESLALQELAKREGLEPQEEAIATRVAEVRAELAERDYDPARLQEVVCEDLCRENALAWLEKNAQVELVPEGTLQAPEAGDSGDDTAIADVPSGAEGVETQAPAAASSEDSTAESAAATAANAS